VKKSKIVYIDLDDVCADFYKAAQDPKSISVLEERMFDKNFFLNLEPIPGAKVGVFQLIKMGFDVWILSQPFTLLPESYMHKAQWVQLHFPQLANKLILTQNKGLNLGHFLIDDNKKWQEKFEQYGGKFIHFEYGGYNLVTPQDPKYLWEDIIETFKEINPYLD
jgi:5'(3')-deoxyribonucleotidase